MPVLGPASPANVALGRPSRPRSGRCQSAPPSSITTPRSSAAELAFAFGLHFFGVTADNPPPHATAAKRPGATSTALPVSTQPPAIARPPPDQPCPRFPSCTRPCSHPSSHSPRRRSPRLKALPPPELAEGVGHLYAGLGIALFAAPALSGTLPSIRISTHFRARSPALAHSKSTMTRQVYRL